MNWFYQQSRRDQVAIIICALCVALFLVWVLGIKPLAAASEASKVRYEGANASLARVKALATSLKYHQSQSGNQSSNASASIEQTINSSSRANDLRFVTLNPSRNGEEATVRFENVALANLVSWLYQLESQYGVQILDLNINATDTSGYVMVTVRLRKT